MTHVGFPWWRRIRAGVGVWVALMVYTLVASVTVFRHEMWRDEMHAWQAVVASDSLLELVANMQSAGHPLLWYLVLYPVSRLTTDPSAIQFVHLAIALASAAVVLLAAPLPFSWRVLFIFGYFPVYEYAAISRSYAIGGLLLFVFCALYGARGSRPLMLAGVLALLAQASVHALILSFSLGIMWVADTWSSRCAARIRAGVAGAALALWLVGIAVSVWQLAGARQVYQDIDAERRMAIKPFDLERMRDSQYVLEVLATPWRGCLPLPRPRFAFWNTNILDGVAGGDVLQAVLGIGLLVVLGSLFARCRPALLLFVVGSSGLLALAWLVYRGALRHHGHHLLVLIAALWLARTMERGRHSRYGSACGPLGAMPRRTALVGLLLIVNVAAGAYAVVRDWHDPFSAGQEVAEFIRSEGLTGLPIVGQRDVVAAVVSGYLGQPVYCAALDRETPFLRWSLASRRPMSDSETLRRARSLAEETGREVLILMRKHAGAQPHRLDGAIWAGRFAHSIVPNERFELYLVPRPEPTAPSSGAASDPGPVPRG